MTGGEENENDRATRKKYHPFISRFYEGTMVIRCRAFFSDTGD